MRHVRYPPRAEVRNVRFPATRMHPAAPVEGRARTSDHHRHHDPGERPGAFGSNRSIASRASRSSSSRSSSSQCCSGRCWLAPWAWAGQTGALQGSGVGDGRTEIGARHGHGKPLGRPRRASAWWCAASFSRLHHSQEHGDALTMAGPLARIARASRSPLAVLKRAAGLSSATSPVRPRDDVQRRPIPSNSLIRNL